MPTVQSLRKKLRGIRSTQKLSNAMKTAATVKYSRLATLFSNDSEYERECSRLYKNYSSEWTKSFPAPKEDAPVCFIILGANKGMCGKINAELAAFAEKEIGQEENPVCLVCGKKLIEYFRLKHLPLTAEFEFGDVPSSVETEPLAERIYSGLLRGEFSTVKIIYQKYRNMMVQTPSLMDLFIPSEEDESSEQLLFVPDKQTIISKTVKTVIGALVFRRVSETSLGAQAATLMTMRSAYDTATELCNELEAEINRQRQSSVTADVLETAVEYTQETEV